ERQVEREGEVEEGEAAQSVIPEEQHAVVPAVRKPAGRERAHEIECADDGKKPSGLDLGYPVIDASGDKVRADEAVRAEATDEKRAEEEPKVPAAHPYH